MGASGVYFLAGADKVKIGYATDVGSRARGIANMSPVPLDLWGVLKHPKPAFLEAYLHLRFQTVRSHGEWFDQTEEIRAVALGEIDLSTVSASYAAKHLDVGVEALIRSGLAQTVGNNGGRRVIRTDLAAVAEEMDVERARRWGRTWAKAGFQEALEAVERQARTHGLSA